MAMAVPAKRPCGAVSSHGTSMVMHGELFPCRDFAISTKPGEGFHCWAMGFSGGVFALWLEMVNELTTGVVVVGFDCPILQATTKEPLAWALWFWLQLHSQEWVGSVGLDVLEDVMLTQAHHC